MFGASELCVIMPWQGHAPQSVEKGVSENNGKIDGTFCKICEFFGLKNNYLGKRS